jgi:Domain of unknown function (DUF4157)
MSRAAFARRAAVEPIAKPKTQAPAGGLRIGAPDDAYEREAARVSDAVMSVGSAAPKWSLSTMSVWPSVQRKCDCGDSASGAGNCEECAEKKKLRRTPNGSESATPPVGGRAPAIVHDVIRSSGEPLAPPARAFFEPRFGVDFARIRVHADSKAGESARAVDALAYTVGEHVAFAPGRYAPYSNEGRRLIAHELTHAVQQRTSSVGGPLPESTSQLGSDPIPAAPTPVTQRDRRGRLTRQDVGAGAARPVPGPQVEKTEAEKLKDIGNSEEYGREGGTWGWGAPETNNVYQRCVVAPLERAKFVAFYRSLGHLPWRSRKPRNGEEALAVVHLDPNEAKAPPIAANPVSENGKTAFKLKPTHAEMPPLRSAYTQAGRYDEGVKHNSDPDCAPQRIRLGTGAFPIHWTMTPDGAEKAKQGEQEHCDDIRAAFDMTLGLYASAINNQAASERTYRTEAEAIKDGERAAGVNPNEMLLKFYQMALKTKIRDDNDWHTAKPIGDPRKKDQPLEQNCEYFYTIDASSWPEIGAHPTSAVITPDVAAKPEKKTK